MKVSSFLRPIAAAVALTAICSGSAYAAWYNDPNTSAAPIAKVVSVLTFQDGSMQIQFDRKVCGNATTNNISWISLGQTANGYAQTAEGRSNLLQIANSAMLSGRNVQVYSDTAGTPSTCVVGGLKLL